jgi:hypothetical protein
MLDKKCTLGGDGRTFYKGEFRESAGYISIVVCWVLAAVVSIPFWELFYTWLSGKPKPSGSFLLLSAGINLCAFVAIIGARMCGSRVAGDLRAVVAASLLSPSLLLVVFFVVTHLRS